METLDRLGLKGALSLDPSEAESTPMPRKELMGFRAIELFAGVGGFRLGLQRAGWDVAWSNQWEPGKKVQHASNCYVQRFGPANHVNGDIAAVPISEIPEHDLLTGGF